MQSYTYINSQARPYSPDAGMRRLQGKAPTLYGDATTQQHFADNYNPAAYQASMELGRGATQAQGQYYNKAADAQNQSALAGLNLLSDQEQNARARNQAAQQIAYGWMGDMFGGMNKLLGGLL